MLLQMVWTKEEFSLRLREREVEREREEDLTSTSSKFQGFMFGHVLYKSNKLDFYFDFHYFYNSVLFIPCSCSLYSVSCKNHPVKVKKFGCVEPGVKLLMFVILQCSLEKEIVHPIILIWWKKRYYVLFSYAFCVRGFPRKISALLYVLANLIMVVQFYFWCC